MPVLRLLLLSLALPCTCLPEDVAHLEGLISTNGCQVPTYDTLDVNLAKTTRSPILFKGAFVGQYNHSAWGKDWDTMVKPFMPRGKYMNIQMSNPVLQHLNRSSLFFDDDDVDVIIVSAGNEGFVAPQHAHSTVYAVRFTGKVVWSLGPPNSQSLGMRDTFTNPAHKFCVHEEGDLLVVPSPWSHGTCHLESFNTGLAFSVMSHQKLRAPEELEL